MSIHPDDEHRPGRGPRGGGDPDRDVDESLLTDPRRLADLIELKRRTPKPPVSDGGVDPDRFE